MATIRDKSMVTDHFSNIASPAPPTTPVVSPAPPVTPPSGGGGSYRGGNRGGGGGNRGGNWGRGGGYGYPVPVPVGGFGYPMYAEPMNTPVVVATIPAPSAVTPVGASTKEATPIDMMGLTPYVIAGGISAIAGYFIAESKGKNVWHGAGIAGGAVVGLMFLYNYSQKKK
jgi:hypothetical protein